MITPPRTWLVTFMEFPKHVRRPHTIQLALEKRGRLNSGAQHHSLDLSLNFHSLRSMVAFYGASVIPWRRYPPLPLICIIGWLRCGRTWCSLSHGSVSCTPTAAFSFCSPAMQSVRGCHAPPTRVILRCPLCLPHRFPYLKVGVVDDEGGGGSQQRQHTQGTRQRREGGSGNHTPADQSPRIERGQRREWQIIEILRWNLRREPVLRPGFHLPLLRRPPHLAPPLPLLIHLLWQSLGRSCSGLHHLPQRGTGDAAGGDGTRGRHESMRA